MWRGTDTLCRGIVCDVCDRMKVNYNKEASIERMEMNLMMRAFNDTFDRLTPEKQAETLTNMRIEKSSNSTANAGLTPADAR